MLSMLLKLFKALNSEVGPWQIGFAGALAMIIGLTPFWSIHNLFILFIAFVFRVHMATFFVFLILFSGLAYLLDPWFHQLGYGWLTDESLSTFWTGLYQNDFWQATRFNHSITLGSLAVTLALFFPMALLIRISVTRYRAHLMPWFLKLKVIQVLKSSKLYELYERVDG